MNYHLTKKSSNSKTGPIPVSTMPRQTCPDSCALKNNGCYGENFPLCIHWDKVSRGERGTTFDSHCDEIASLPNNALWRFGQVGDLPGIGDQLDPGKLSQLVNANAGKRGFGYTHKPLTAKNQEHIQSANELGFTINISADSLAHADEIADLGLKVPIVALVELGSPAAQTTPQGRKVKVCPAQTHDGITCRSCALCSVSYPRVIVGFYPHGSKSKAANNVAKGLA